MKCASASSCLLAGFVLVSGVNSRLNAQVSSAARDGAYRAIVQRNIFDLRPVPAPPENKLPPTPAPNVSLIGLMTTSGEPQVVLSVLEPGPGKQPQTLVFVAGQRRGNIEVKEIDMVSKMARVVVDDNVLMFKLETSKSGPSPAGPAVAGGVSRPAFTLNPPATPPTPFVRDPSVTLLPNGRTSFNPATQTPMVRPTPTLPALPPPLRPRATGTFAPPVPGTTP